MQVFLSHAGVASRRKAEEIISQGRVSVNGVRITEQGTKVDPKSDIVLLDGKELHIEEKKLYLALNKPAGFICTSSDPQGRPLALSLFSDSIKERLYSVGRLDFMSCGLIIFTNDGNFAARLGHPASNTEKEYIVEATGPIPDSAIEAFNKGITIEDIHYKAKEARRISRKSVKIVLVEGKNREIRRVFSHFHLHPKIFQRVRIGNVLLGDLKEGSYRELTDTEIKSLGGNEHGHSD